MRYDKLRELYPGIEDLLSQVAEYCHGKAGSDLALGWAERQIARLVPAEYQEDVTEKVRQFINAIKGAGL